MNNNFYNRMLKSSKRQLVPEKRNIPMKESMYESATPSTVKTAGKTYKRNSSTMPKKKDGMLKVNKARSITTKTMNSMMFASFDEPNQIKGWTSSHARKWLKPSTERKKSRRGSKCGSATVRNLNQALNKVPVENKSTKVTAVLSTSVHFQNPPKKFKKQVVHQQASKGYIFDGRNSLNQYINAQNKVKCKHQIDSKSVKDTEFSTKGTLLSDKDR